MEVYNYVSYAKAFELGVSNPNMTKIAKALFKPIIDLDGVVNRSGNMYTIDSKNAKSWYEGGAIPEGIKNAAGRQELFDSIGDYFASYILGVVTNPAKECVMYSAMFKLIRNSDLEQEQKNELLNLYEKGEKPEFMGLAFIYAIVRDNTKKSLSYEKLPIDDDIRCFKELIKKKYKKPKSILPPNEIEDHEIKYVKELYRVYHEKTGEYYARPEDLDAEPKLKNNFNRQRKDYYSAETIRRELRDTIRLDEEDGFNILKDEVYDGVITTCEKPYQTGFERMTAVMEHVTQVSLSNNLQDRMLDWIGPGEKKGVCHMLIIDSRLWWIEEEDDEK